MADALARLGLERKIAVAGPHFLVAPHIVASSDLLLTVAERVAEVVVGPLGLVVLAPPQELGLTGFTLSLLWHERTRCDIDDVRTSGPRPAQATADVEAARRVTVSQEAMNQAVAAVIDLAGYRQAMGR